jgi:anti-anti-sigma factor
MNVYSDTANGILFLRPNHDVDFEVAKEIQERLTIAANDDIAFAIIDFSLAVLVSTATLRVILDAANQIRHRRGRLAVTGASQQFHRLLVVSDVLKIVPAFQSIKKAQAHLLTFVNESSSLFDERDSEI